MSDCQAFYRWTPVMLKFCFVEPDCLDGLVVKVSASRRADLGFDSLQGYFWVESYH